MSIREQIVEYIASAAGVAPEGVVVSIPEHGKFGHYATNVALQCAEEQGKEPRELAEKFKREIEKNAPKDLFEKIEIAGPGFLNFWLTPSAIQAELLRVAKEKDGGVPQIFKGKTVMVEYTDPNPFKLFHIGHLMSNAIGESLARLYEAVGAKVIRANYQGDVGLHVAMSVWGMQNVHPQLPKESTSLEEKVKYLGDAYAAGSKAYRDEEGDRSVKNEIEEINVHIYAKDNPEINKLYETGRAWSLEYFEGIYERLGTKFDRYFFESEVGEEGKEIVLAHPEVFEESDGAVVFRGEKYGFHTRVFLNSRGLPTYEAKDLGLNKRKFELYPLDVSLILTGDEVKEYFQVVLKAMELVLPEVAEKTQHIPHGMLRLPQGKMSSRTGDVITADALIRQVAEKVKERMEGEHEVSLEDDIAIGAIKYSILKQRPGQDIVFDMEKSLSLQGDSGPYLQYTHARLRSILRKGEGENTKPSREGSHTLIEEEELSCVLKLVEFPSAVKESIELMGASRLAAYLYDLAGAANAFYAKHQILADENAARRAARLLLVETMAGTLRRGLELLGIKAPERM